MFAIVVILQNVKNIDASKYMHNFPGTQSSSAKHDCDVETLYSVEDAQCAALCKHPGVFVSMHGACVNMLAFNQDIIHNGCDPKKGVLAYLLGNSQFGNTQLFCLSIDEGVQPDNVTEPNTICTGGEIDINYIETFPQLSQCKCPDNKVLAVIPNTNTIRSRGVCVDKNYENFLKYNNSLYIRDNI